MCFPVNFVKFLIKSSFIEHLWWLLLMFLSFQYSLWKKLEIDFAHEYLFSCSEFKVYCSWWPDNKWKLKGNKLSKLNIATVICSMCLVGFQYILLSVFISFSVLLLLFLFCFFSFFVFLFWLLLSRIIFSKPSLWPFQRNYLMNSKSDLFYELCFFGKLSWTFSLQV